MGPGAGRKLHLSDEDYLHLRRAALETGKTASRLVSELIRKHLPRFEVRRVG